MHVDYDETAKMADAAVTLDAEITYFLNESMSFSVGAQNLLDQEAEKLDFSGASDFIPNNNWGGQYYETSPFGINGGYYYVKATYTF